MRAGFKTPTYENLDVPLGRKYADKIRALGVGKGAQTIGDMYTIFVYELDGKGGMLQVWLMKNFGMSAELSSELTHKLYHGEFGKRARTLKQALAGPHSGWLVDVPGVDGSAGEDAVKVFSSA